MDIQGINQLIGQLQPLTGKNAQTGAVQDTSFSDILKTSLNQVNTAQREAEHMAKNFELNVPGTNLHEVMVSLQEANISFQTMVQVRNKLVTAYQDIMNMQA